MSDSTHNSGPFGKDVPHLRLAGAADDSPDSPALLTPGNTPDNNPDDPRRLIHELANLLDGSLRNFSLALSRLDDAHEQHNAPDGRTVDQLRTADATLKQMAALIHGWHQDKCAAFTQIQQRTTPLQEVIDHAVKLIRPVADLQQIELSIEVDRNVSGLPAGALYPVILNALRNALESIERDGHIQLHAQRAADDLQITIADDGPGVSQALPRDSDGLVAAGVSTKVGGSGLGLAISRDIVRALGGVIRLEPNDSATHGAVLLIRIPLTPSPSGRGLGRGYDQ